MFAKIAKNNSFGATVGYVMGPGDQKIADRAELIGGNCASRDAQGIAAEMQALNRDDAKKPVLHFSLNAAPGERLTDEQWNAVARDFLRGYGIDPDRHQHIIVRHTDKHHDHVHVVASRTDFEGQLARSPYKDYKLSRQLCRDIEKSRGLQPGEDRRQASAGLVSEIRQKVTAARDASRGQGFSELKAQLSERGVKVIEYRHEKSGKLNGLAFEVAGHRPIKAGALGREFTAGQLSEEMSPTPTTKSRTATMAGKQAGAAAGKAISGAMSKMHGIPKIPGMGGMSMQLGKGLAAGMQSALKSVQQQASKQQKRRDHELE